MPKIYPTLEFTHRANQGMGRTTISREPQKTVDANWMMMRRIYERTAKVVNGMLSYGNSTSGADNIDGKWVSATTPGTPNTNFTLTHNLGRTPTGYHVMTKSAACDVYTGSVAATETQITLKATVAGVTLEFFIL